jgi:hypothetical protein
MDDAMHLRKPDRVPVAPLVCTFYPTKVKGVSNRDAMYRLDVSLRAWKEVTIAHNWDAAPPPTNLMPARPMEILGLTQFKWPGGGLADGQPFQWVEGEYMKQDEYDEMLADPNGFAVKKLWPRISTRAPQRDDADAHPSASSAFQCLLAAGFPRHHPVAASYGGIAPESLGFG